MIDFEVMGIVITVTTTSQSEAFKDATHTTRHRFVKETSVNANFLGFSRTEQNFTDLITIKSVLQYWINSYWMRGGKNSDLIRCRTTLNYSSNYDSVDLILKGTQIQGTKQLHICCLVNGTLHEEAYLDCRQVIQLDIALGKAINFIRPSETVLPAKKLF